MSFTGCGSFVATRNASKEAAFLINYLVGAHLIPIDLPRGALDCPVIIKEQPPSTFRFLNSEPEFILSDLDTGEEMSDLEVIRGHITDTCIARLEEGSTSIHRGLEVSASLSTKMSGVLYDHRLVLLPSAYHSSHRPELRQFFDTTILSSSFVVLCLDFPIDVLTFRRDCKSLFKAVHALKPSLVTDRRLFLCVNAQPHRTQVPPSPRTVNRFAGGAAVAAGNSADGKNKSRSPSSRKGSTLAQGAGGIERLELSHKASPSPRVISGQTPRQPPSTCGGVSEVEEEPCPGGVSVSAAGVATPRGVRGREALAAAKKEGIGAVEYSESDEDSEQGARGSSEEEDRAEASFMGVLSNSPSKQTPRTPRQTAEEKSPAKQRPAPEEKRERGSSPPVAASPRTVPSIVSQRRQEEKSAADSLSTEGTKAGKHNTDIHQNPPSFDASTGAQFLQQSSLQSNQSQQRQPNCPQYDPKKMPRLSLSKILTPQALSKDSKTKPKKQMSRHQPYPHPHTTAVRVVHRRISRGASGGSEKATGRDDGCGPCFGKGRLERRDSTGSLAFIEGGDGKPVGKEEAIEMVARMAEEIMEDDEWDADGRGDAASSIPDSLPCNLWEGDVFICRTEHAYLGRVASRSVRTGEKDEERFQEAMATTEKPTAPELMELRGRSQSFDWFQSLFGCTGTARKDTAPLSRREWGKWLKRASNMEGLEERILQKGIRVACGSGSVVDGDTGALAKRALAFLLAAMQGALVERGAYLEDAVREGGGVRGDGKVYRGDWRFISVSRESEEAGGETGRETDRLSVAAFSSEPSGDSGESAIVEALGLEAPDPDTISLIGHRNIAFGAAFFGLRGATRALKKLEDFIFGQQQQGHQTVPGGDTRVAADAQTLARTLTREGQGAAGLRRQGRSHRATAAGPPPPPPPGGPNDGSGEGGDSPRRAPAPPPPPAPPPLLFHGNSHVDVFFYPTDSRWQSGSARAAQFGWLRKARGWGGEGGEETGGAVEAAQGTTKPNRPLFIGAISRGVPHGYGHLYWPNGREALVGFWNNGVLSGECLLLAEDSGLVIGKLKMEKGEPVGLAREVVHEDRRLFSGWPFTHRALPIGGPVCSFEQS